MAAAYWGSVAEAVVAVGESSMADGIIAELAKLGLAGLFIGYLIWRGIKQDERYDDLAKRCDLIQERRAEEREKNAAMMASSAEAHKSLAAAVEHNAEVVGSLTEKITSALIERGRRRS